MNRTALTLFLLLAAPVFAADPIYLDQMMEMPLGTLQRTFPDLRREGCYQLGPDRYLLIEIEKKDQKPERIVLSTAAPCRRPVDAPNVDVRARNGVELGIGPAEILSRAGKPDTAARPDSTLKRFGDLEYFFICRVSDGCARHTSIFLKDGVVSAIAEWYSE